MGRGTILLTKLLFMYHAMFINPSPFLRRYRHLLPLDLKPLPQIAKEPFHLHVQRRCIDISLIRRVLKLAANVMPCLIYQIDRVTFDPLFALYLIWLLPVLFRPQLIQRCLGLLSLGHNDLPSRTAARVLNRVLLLPFLLDLAPLFVHRLRWRRWVDRFYCLFR